MEEGLLACWIMALCSWLCAVIFWGIAIVFRHRTGPAHFWSGSTVELWEIRDIPAYNRANARMWGIYGALWAVTGAVAFWNVAASAILMVLIAVGGIPVLVTLYGKIYAKYRAE